MSLGKTKIIAFFSSWLLTVAVTGYASAEDAKIVALGDSNTSGYGVGSQDAFPARMEKILRKKGRPVRVVNAGVPGDTLG